jgi:hypothetical protein
MSAQKKPTLVLLIVAASCLFFGAGMIFVQPSSYNPDATYRVDHKMNGRTYRSEYKNGQELLNEQPGNIRGTQIGGALLFAFGAAAAYFALKKNTHGHIPHSQ